MGFENKTHTGQPIIHHSKGSRQIAVVAQPGEPEEPVEWMSRPEGGGLCPPGLEYLVGESELVIKQKMHYIEMLSPHHLPNKYSIQNKDGQQMYFAMEETEQIFKGIHREFDMSLLDNEGTELIRYHRPGKCVCMCFCSACCECVTQEITVESPPGTKIGNIVQNCSCCSVSLTLFDGNEVEALRLHDKESGRCGADVVFEIAPTTDLDAPVSTITRKSKGIIINRLDRADTFVVMFPEFMDVKTKALILGAVFLVDFMFFEQKPQQKRRR